MQRIRVWTRPRAPALSSTVGPGELAADRYLMQPHVLAAKYVKHTQEGNRGWLLATGSAQRQPSHGRHAPAHTAPGQCSPRRCCRCPPSAVAAAAHSRSDQGLMSLWHRGSASCRLQVRCEAGKPRDAEGLGSSVCSPPSYPFRCWPALNDLRRRPVNGIAPAGAHPEQLPGVRKTAPSCVVGTPHAGLWTRSSSHNI